MTFTPGGGLDDEFQRQKDLQKDDVSVETEFEDAQIFEKIYDLAKNFDPTGGRISAVFDFIKLRSQGKDAELPTEILKQVLPQDQTGALDTTKTPSVLTLFEPSVSEQGVNFINQLLKRVQGNKVDLTGGATDEQIMQAYRERTGELDLDPNRRVETGTSGLTGSNSNLLNMVQSPSGSGPTGKITYRNIPKLDRFLSGQTTSLDRTTAGLIQNANFKLGDFLQGIDQELERVRRQYPNIDVDTNLQRFKWQWHHINPDKMPVDFYVGLNNVNDRNLITDTLLRETNVSAGMNPSNRIGLPTEVHDEITAWLDTEIGKRSEVITQKISDDLGYGLTLTGRGSRAAKLQFNQRFANEPVQTRIPYIIEYGQKIAESTQILDELMKQFDIFYDIPNGYRLDIDVNTMEQMLSRLEEGKPTIPTLREIIEEVTDGMRIPVSDDLGRQSIAVPRDPNLIRAIDIEGMLRDSSRGQSVLNQRQIRSLQKELNEIYQMDLDIEGASTSAYIRAWYNERFGGDRRTGPKTGPN